ncbi:MAG: TetR/AcrR family transcriptional regulator [Lachnospiraceae bacterium]|nr:TetR/AcrR family transcriptional regulator [Lachnospiraceae bacterium]
MPKGSPELTEARRTEIMDACRQLYETMTFKEVNLKEIGEVTSFTRTSIYNYFESKEEIFLGLFEDEYIKWTIDLQKIIDGGAHSRDKLAKKLAESLGRRKLMLKLLSVNLYDMEENSRMECLVSFKKAYGRSRDVLEVLIKKNYPGIKKKELDEFIFSFLPFLHGVHPYAFATEKQLEAMKEAKVRYNETTIEKLVYTGLMKLLPGKPGTEEI